MSQYVSTPGVDARRHIGSHKAAKIFRNLLFIELICYISSYVMELGRNWGAVDPTRAKTFQRLGAREQNAVRVALVGISQWQQTKEQPKSMRIQTTEQRTFDLRAFAGTLHELGIGITDLKCEGSSTVIFQPKPYSRTFMPQTDGDRLDALIESFDDTISNLPSGIQKMVKKSRTY